MGINFCGRINAKYFMQTQLSKVSSLPLLKITSKSTHFLSGGKKIRIELWLNGLNFKQIKQQRPQNLKPKQYAVKKLKTAKTFSKNVNKEATWVIFFFTVFSVCLLAQINAQKINCFIKNLFSKWEHMPIKLRIYSHLLNKLLTGNFMFSVVNIIGFTTQPCKFFFKSNCQSLVYLTSINTWHRLVSSLVYRNHFLACCKELELSAQELLHDKKYTFITYNIL